MRRIKRAVALILAAAIIYGILPGIPAVVYAAPLPVNLYVDSYSKGTLDFHWDPLDGTSSVVITYHTPDQGNSGVEQTVVLNQTANSASVSGLKNDYIYDIHVKIYDQPDGLGEMIGEGLLYYIPRISFYNKIMEQSYDDIPGGGRETGHRPRLNLRWAMPKVFDSASGSFVYANSALGAMQDTLNSVYNDGRQLSTLNFRINISSELSLLNGDSSQSTVIIDCDETGYTANVSGIESVTSKVYDIDLNGYMNFDIIGRRDEDTPVPVDDGEKDNYLLPGEDHDVKDYMLPDGDIMPGTIYYMNIKPYFKNTPGTPVNAVTVGEPDDQNGSKFMGPVPYTYTPLLFQLTKDSANNIYAKIFKINKGSLDLPRLYYEIQTTDDPSIPGDWTVKKTLDDTYFSGEYAITVLTGINPNNEIYYRIVVKSDDISNRLESPKMPYKLADDISRPPVPTGIKVVNRQLSMRTIDGEIQKATDVTISWDKPSDWEKIKANLNPDDDIVFHIMLNIHQSNLDIHPDPVLESEGEVYGNFPVKYRLVKYVSSKNVIENGNRLEYTLKGFDLFKGEYYTGGIPEIDIEDIDNPENYPDFLLPNKVYYITMYTAPGKYRGTSKPEHMSGLSLVSSFTTLPGIQKDVPVVKNLEVISNTADETRDPVTGEVISIDNKIELRFEKININWSYYTSKPEGNNKIFYDIYAGRTTEADSFILLGSTDSSLDTGNVIFDGVTNNLSAHIKVSVGSFKEGTRAYNVLGGKLRPNTTYYFYVKTRLVIETPPSEAASVPTSILPVTTVKGSVGDPDDSAARPLALEDFGIVEDGDGNPLITGSSVVLGWSKREPGVKYEIICTSERVGPYALKSSYENDPVYLSYINAFDGVDLILDEKVCLDPGADPPHAPGKLAYNSSTGFFTYNIDTWLFPNKLYYFSIRSVDTSNGKESVWISIPVTTSLIEGPLQLAAVNDYQLGFFWIDDSLNMMPEDYKVYIKEPHDKEYSQLTRSQCTIVKDGDGKTYYARIAGLEPDTSYSVRVYKGNNNEILVFQDNSMKTRDGFREVEVMWRGKPVDDYSGYEIAIMEAGDSEYSVLMDYDLEHYINKDGRSLPYYIEETAQTRNSSDIYYHAKIKRIAVKQPGGSIIHEPLKPNTKYYIKVRAVKVDPADSTLISYSKYAGPVQTRTEFDQGDYDDEDQKEKGKAEFLDRISRLEKELFWRVAINNSSANRILIKGERTVNALQNSTSNAIILDISEYGVNIDNDEIYIPLSVAKTLNNEKKSLIIRTRGTEFTIRPETLDIQNSNEITPVQGWPGVNDLLLKLTITRSDGVVKGLPTKTRPASKVNTVKLKAQGVSKTDRQLQDIIHDKLYNKETGLVNEKLNILLNHTSKGNIAHPELLKAYIDELIKLVEQDLSIFVYSTIETVKVTGAIKNVADFGKPAMVRIYYNNSRKGLKQPYVHYDGEDSWRKISDISSYSGSMAFNVSKTGRYIIQLSQVNVSDVDDSHPAKDSIDKFLSKYDLSSVFKGINNSFEPGNRVTGRETILLYEIMVGKLDENTGLDIKQKAIRLGLDGIIGASSIMGGITRQETAGVIIKIYSEETGVDINSLKPGRNVFIKDESEINDKHYKSVVLTVDLGIYTLEGDRSFRPKSYVTRAEMIEALVKMLELTGEL
jgi:hypothetical protein